MKVRASNIVVPADLRATLDKLHGLYGRGQSLANILDRLNTRLMRAREMYGPERSMPQVVTGIYDKLDNVRRLYSTIYGYDMSIEEILDVIILHTRRLGRLVELQSHTMVSGAELEEIEFLKRMSRRCVCDLAKEKAPQRAAMGERAQPIVMPTENATATTERLAVAAQSSPTKKRSRQSTNGRKRNSGKSLSTST
jgi:hypothetical protein